MSTWITPHVSAVNEIETAANLNGYGSDLTLLANALQVYGVSLAGYAGVAPALGKPVFLIQAGSIAPIVTNASGGANISWPNVFPNGLLTCFLASGDSVAGGSVTIIPTATSTNSGGSNFIAYQGTVACNTVTLRVNFLAIGF